MQKGVGSCQLEVCVCVCLCVCVLGSDLNFKLLILGQMLPALHSFVLVKLVHDEIPESLEASPPPYGGES